MQFGKSFEKYIPEEIKNLTKEGIKAFLDAYVLGDGTIKTTRVKLKGQKNPGISRNISTSSKRIADDLTEIILKAGYSVSYRLEKTKGKMVKFKNGDYTINHDTWRINIKTSHRVQIAKKEEFEYSGRVYCVSVPNQTILVRSNGKVLFIGNCRCRWMTINPEYQYVDKDGQIHLRVEDEDSWQTWYKGNIEQ
jgi:intein/homing endonuclease